MEKNYLLFTLRYYFFFSELPLLSSTMSIRAFIALLLIYLAYLVIGGFLFKAIEHQTATEETKTAKINVNKLAIKIHNLQG